MNQRVAELFSIIHDAQFELDLIRARCPHTEFFIGWWSWRPGAQHPSRICKECHGAVKGITQQEEEDFRKSQEGSFTTFSASNVAIP